MLIDFFKSLDSFLGPQLTTLVSSVAEQCTKHVIVTPESCTKYLYFNKLNLAYKSTIHVGNRRCSNVLTTPEVLRVITDIYNDTNKLVFSIAVLYFRYNLLLSIKIYFVSFQIKRSWGNYYKNYEPLLGYWKTIKFEGIFCSNSTKECKYN